MKKTKKAVKKVMKTRKPALKSKVQRLKPKATTGIHLTGEPMLVEKKSPAMVIQWPRTLMHHHTYGLLSPFFEGLKKGKLMATKCRTPGCETGFWLPPRADCPDCLTRMKWIELKNPVIGEIFTFTHVEYPGHGIEISYPYYQIDVKIPGAATIMKGYLAKGEAKIGMKVKACFRTKGSTNTILDLYWEPAQ
ncbi:hypothetical protein JXD38_05650 [candidate division WOR-3 bacterium]|nr:hypothetical protein [candidate division WOR-3 bacterium]